MDNEVDIGWTVQDIRSLTEYWFESNFTALFRIFVVIVSNLTKDANRQRSSDGGVVPGRPEGCGKKRRVRITTFWK